MDPKAVAQLMEMGVSRAAAISALKACKGDANEAAMIVFEDRHANALDEGDTPEAAASGSKRKGKAPEAMEISLEDDGADDDDEVYDGASEEGGDFFGELEEGEGGADPFAQIAFQKDRKETVIEIEEEPVGVTITVQGQQVNANLMPQGEWMKGCPEGTEQSFLFQVYNRLTEPTCACPAEQCSETIGRQRTDFFAIPVCPVGRNPAWVNIPASFQTYLHHLSQVVQRTCSACHRVVCLACGEEVGSTTYRTPSGAIDEPPEVLLHCPDLQAVILGVGLSLVEDLYYGAQATSSPQAASERPAKKKKVVEDPDEDDGSYSPFVRGSRCAPGGTGYGGAHSGADDQSGQEAAFKAQLARDKAMADLMAAVRTFMPNRERKGAFRPSDHMPSIATAIHIRRRFNPIASELLKNDSLADMSERRDLYTEFLNWLEIMAAHENLCAIMGQPIMRVVSTIYSTPPSRTVSSGRSTPMHGRRERTIVFEGSAGPRELLEGISRQVKAAKHAMSSKTEPGSELEHKIELNYYQSLRVKENEDVEKLETFCNAFVKAIDSIDKSMRHNNNTAVLQALQGPADANSAALDDLSRLSLDALKERYLAWSEKVRYEYYDFEMPLTAAELAAREAAKSTDAGVQWSAGPSYKHAFSKDIQAVYSYPSRNTAIAREHSTLSSSLPVSWDSSVFLRVDDGRPDVMKALITGPEGTPYSNGCFVFDIFLGSNYNQKPPLVKTMTTKGGKYRLNPNLYSDGKVCLSLLGTWQGPGWIPGKSTLLQVIISIQSMILCDEPYLNEPGWANMAGTPQSRAYGLNVRRMVLDDAMIESIKKPNEAFADVIRTHFRLKSKAIRQQLDSWLREDDGQALNRDNAGGAIGEARAGIGQSSHLRDNVAEMKRLLDKLDMGIWPVQ